ncbi:MAG: hypothetical protein M3540_10450 [Actinomycetota bacterium]|nr:hypothetical protein [Actinomycetota bacterium]
MADDALFIVLLVLGILGILSVVWAFVRVVVRLFWTGDVEPAGRDSNTFRRKTD